MTTKTRTPEEIRAAREARREWYGWLAHENVAHVADRIRAILTGQKYTFVHSNTVLTHAAPDVRTSQRLSPVHSAWIDGSDPVRMWDPKDGLTGISVSDTYGVWGVSTSYITELAAYADTGSKMRVYLHIEGGVGDDPHRPGKITIAQHNGHGELMHWVIAVEHDDPDHEATLEPQALVLEKAADAAGEKWPPAYGLTVPDRANPTADEIAVWLRKRANDVRSGR